MKSISLVLFSVALVLSGCKKELEELPKTSFVTAREYLESLKPISSFVVGTTDSEINIDFNGKASIQIEDIGISRFWSTYGRMNGMVRIEATYYDNALEMFYAGLPTISFGELITSEGAFELKSWVNDTLAYPSRFDVSFSASYPLSNSMHLFSGVVSDAGVNWASCFEDPATPGCFLGAYPEPFDYYSGYVVTQVADWFENEGVTLVNCDDFPNVPTSRTDVIFNLVNIPEGISGRIEGGLFFNDLNSYMTFDYQNQTGLAVRNVPTTLECNALIVVVADQTLYFGLQQITVSENQGVELELTPVSESELQSILESL